MNHDMSTRTARGPDLLLTLVALIWGSGFIFTNFALRAGMAPTLLLTLRFLIPTVVMAVLFRQELACAAPQDLKFGAVAGGILFVAFLAQTYGIRYTTPSNSAFLTTTNVVMVPFLGWALFHRRPSFRSTLLALLCFVGMAVLSWSPGVGITFNFGDWLTLLCAFCYACHVSYLGGSAERSNSAAVLSFMQLAVAGLLSLVSFVLLERHQFTLDSLRLGMLPAVYLGLFPTGLCFFLQSWAQRRISPTHTAVILSCEGLFGSAFSVLAGYDALSIHLVVGGGLILLSVILLQVDFPTHRKIAKGTQAADNE